jgi:Cu2+-exporting ATPase
VALAAFEGPEELLERVAVLEEHSSHPFARALREALPVPRRGYQVQEARDTAGSGVTGRVDNRHLVVGTAALVRQHVGEIGAPWEERVLDIARRGASPVLVAEEGRVTGLLSFEDPLRSDTRQAVGALRRLGLSVGILSGDHPDAVAQVARDLGVPADAAQGGLTPEAKLDRVEQLMRSGSPVAMVGDGVNDAGALAAARVGVAVRGGAELALAAADVFLTRAGLGPVVTLLRGSRATLRVVRRNLALSLGYNLAAAALALGGYIEPLLAAILMPLSSLTVVLSSVLARPFGRGTIGRRAPTAPALGTEASAWW